MKRKLGHGIGFAVAACMLFSSGAGYLPQMTGSITASAEQVDWRSYLNKEASWYSSSEATSLADSIMSMQLSDGGWRKDNTITEGSWAKSTIDNDATWSQIRILSKVYNATGTDKYRQSALRGIDLLINGQYDNGGWPQVFGDPGTYHAHITYNDTAMVAVLRLLQEVANCSGDFTYIDSSYASRAQVAVHNGIECILNTQITVNGELTAWGQQHDEYTLAPAAARAYELPSICTAESVGIVDFLRSLPDKDERIIRSINAAVKWFDAVKIEGKKWDWNSDKSDKILTDASGSTIWARFYDLQNSKPLFSDRDGQAYTDVSQISLERRTGYSWYGTWPEKNVKQGLLPLPGEDVVYGTHLYVGYADQAANYATIQQAVDAAALLSPMTEAERVFIHIAPGTYREQVLVNTPFISFVNDTPDMEVKITWYYGIGYQYYSVGDNGYYSAEKAAAKSGKATPVRWGSAVGLKSGAKYFRAEYITFENSFNRYVTDEELADGVELNGKENITFQRYAGADVSRKEATERGAAIAVEGDYSEFYKCTFLGSQDTLYTKGSQGYFRECVIEGNTDYIFGQGDMVFQACELRFKGYSDKQVGGYITAKTSSGKYLLYGCNVTAAQSVAAGYFGRPWGETADVAFVNTTLQRGDLITAAGWTSMSGHAPENANFKEYNTTAGGAPVNTSGRVAGTVRSSGEGLDVLTYLGSWEPYYLNFRQDLTPPPEPVTIEGVLVQGLTPSGTEYKWAIDPSIQVGDLIYTDRDAMTYLSLPEEIIGCEAILTPCSAKNYTGTQAYFTVTKDCEVYVGLDSRVDPAPSWMADFTATGLEAQNSQDVTYKLYKADLSAGDSVTLGMNTTSSYSTNYTVYLKEVRAEATALGDVDRNDVVDVFDMAVYKRYLTGKEELTGTALANADVNRDGTVDAEDLALVQDFVHGKIRTFG
ncbi:MAG: pectate lyase [Oscillospiraceae bacterium]|nr:pectate lyase [Oscillospiraceae bacterium]